ncbi:Signal recognition particle SEC65 subunit [Sphaceloma murrayae]|uniref:Signal recognition particle SEC65 subunit n=1 Tax=Sphaceloma murrayae TaxID=2082308 RepID=A0A2K1QTJ7_9PEZI|nr:Signal recognition particle SEC65 subunit [Sphaceloma murrayae]
MAMNPRIEEVSDSDSDPPEMDPSDLPSNTIIRPADIPSTTASTAPLRQTAPQPPSAAAMAAHREKTKHYQCLYPLYFDSTRTKSQGRRVPSALATPNPLARNIIDALQSPSLLIPNSQIVFEPGKLHPKDWANPGRIRILLRQDGRDMTGGKVKNKEDLMRKIGQWLVDHPTQEEDPKKLQIRGLPLPEDGMPKPAIPRGWKMGNVLPLHSPALSGGGVNEDMFKEMMKEMQGQGGAGNPLAGMANMLGGMGGMGGMGGGGAAAGSSGQQKKIKGKKGK